MSAAATASIEPVEGAGSPLPPLVARQLRTLGELADIGLEVARAIEREAKADPAPQDAAAAPARAELALAYARVARAVRLTVMLQSKLLADHQAQDAAAAQAGADAQARALQGRHDRAEARKASIERIVERVAVAEGRRDKDAVDRLVLDAGERLDDEDLYGDLMQRPLSEIVARICRDMGLSPDWPRLAEELWAKAELDTEAPGAPLAALKPRAASP